MAEKNLTDRTEEFNKMLKWLITNYSIICGWIDNPDQKRFKIKPMQWDTV